MRRDVISQTHGDIDNWYKPRDLLWRCSLVGEVERRVEEPGLRGTPFLVVGATKESSGAGSRAVEDRESGDGGAGDEGAGDAKRGDAKAGDGDTEALGPCDWDLLRDASSDISKFPAVAT